MAELFRLSGVKRGGVWDSGLEVEDEIKSLENGSAGSKDCCDQQTLAYRIRGTIMRGLLRTVDGIINIIAR